MELEGFGDSGHVVDQGNEHQSKTWLCLSLPPEMLICCIFLMTRWLPQSQTVGAYYLVCKTQCPRIPPYHPGFILPFHGSYVAFHF